MSVVVVTHPVRESTCEVPDTIDNFPRYQDAVPIHRLDALGLGARRYEFVAHRPPPVKADDATIGVLTGVGVAGAPDHDAWGRPSRSQLEVTGHQPADGVLVEFDVVVEPQIQVRVLLVGTGDRHPHPAVPEQLHITFNQRDVWKAFSHGLWCAVAAPCIDQHDVEQHVLINGLFTHGSQTGDRPLYTVMAGQERGDS